MPIKKKKQRGRRKESKEGEEKESNLAHGVIACGAMAQHVLVTGGCGCVPRERALGFAVAAEVPTTTPLTPPPTPSFFGAWIVKALLDGGDRVTVVDAELFTKRWEMLMSAEEIAKVRSLHRLWRALRSLRFVAQRCSSWRCAASFPLFLQRIFGLPQVMRPTPAPPLPQVTFVKGRVDEDAFVTTIVSAAPDAIIHLAGLQVPTCRANPVLGARVNVIGTLNVFEAAKLLSKARPEHPTVRIVYASSAAVFGPDAEYGEQVGGRGWLGGAPVLCWPDARGALLTPAPPPTPAQAVGDMSTPKPSSHYGAFKLCTEHAAKAYWLDNKVPSVGLRPLTVYGPGRDAGLTSFPTRAIASVIKGAPFEIPFSGPTVYTHIREVRRGGVGRAISARQQQHLSPPRHPPRLPTSL